AWRTWLVLSLSHPALEQPSLLPSSTANSQHPTTHHNDDGWSKRKNQSADSAPTARIERAEDGEGGTSAALMELGSGYLNTTDIFTPTSLIFIQLVIAIGQAGYFGCGVVDFDRGRGGWCVCMGRT
ncbi:hypothetical protein BDQ17DRAFT_1370221, partial [Cyathus striatus]